MTKQERNELLVSILRIIGAIGLLAVAIAMPGATRAFAPFLSGRTRKGRRDIEEALRYARNQRWIELKQEKGRRVLWLTKAGRRRLFRLQFDRPLAKPKRWDGKWRVLVFDIPDKLKEQRDFLRATLERWGFLPWQESVFISPWPWEKDVDALRSELGLKPFVRLAVAKKIEVEAGVYKKFGLLSKSKPVSV